MELSKALLGAILLGIAVEASSCKKGTDLPQPATTSPTDGSGSNITPNPHIDPCPACGLG